MYLCLYFISSCKNCHKFLCSVCIYKNCHKFLCSVCICKNCHKFLCSVYICKNCHKFLCSVCICKNCHKFLCSVCICKNCHKFLCSVCTFYSYAFLLKILLQKRIFVSLKVRTISSCSNIPWDLISCLEALTFVLM